MKEPKDLKIKIGTKEEAAWTKIMDGAILELEVDKRAIIIGEKIIELAKFKINEEKMK